MKLGATITSERGKPVTKTGNEYILVNITDNYGDVMLTLHVTAAHSNLRGDHYNVYIDNRRSLYIDMWDREKKTGNLKHGK